MSVQHRPRPSRRAHAPAVPPSDEAIGDATDTPDAPDSVGAEGPVEAVATARGDELAGDVERGGERESGSIQAVAHPEEGGGIPTFVESQAGADERDAPKGDS